MFGIRVLHQKYYNCIIKHLFDLRTLSVYCFISLSQFLSCRFSQGSFLYSTTTFILEDYCTFNWQRTTGSILHSSFREKSVQNPHAYGIPHQIQRGYSSPAYWASQDSYLSWGPLSAESCSVGPVFGSFCGWS